MFLAERLNLEDITLGRKVKNSDKMFKLGTTAMASLLKQFIKEGKAEEPKGEVPILAQLHTIKDSGPFFLRLSADYESKCVSTSKHKILGTDVLVVQHSALYTAIESSTWGFWKNKFEGQASSGTFEFPIHHYKELNIATTTSASTYEVLVIDIQHVPPNHLNRCWGIAVLVAKTKPEFDELVNSSRSRKCGVFRRLLARFQKPVVLNELSESAMSYREYRAIARSACKEMMRTGRAF